MGSLTKKVNEYRLGEDWRANFKYIIYEDVARAIRKVLTTTEGKHHYDRLGMRIYTDMSKQQPLSLDEMVFRLAVLVDTQIQRVEEGE